MADVVRTFGISLGVSGIPQFRTGLGKAMEHMNTFSKHVEEFGGKLDQFDAISDKLSSGVSKMAKAMGEMGGSNTFNKSASGLAKFMKSFNDASANYLKPEQFERSLESVVKISQAIHTANVHAQETLRLVAESKKALANFKSAEGSDEFVKNMVLGASARDMTAAVIGGDEKLRVVLKKAISQTRSIIRDTWGSSKLAEESKNQVLEELEKMARESVSFESLMIFVDDLKRKLPRSQSEMAATLENNSASIIASMKAHREKIQAEVDRIIAKNEAMGEDYRASFFRGKNAALSPKTTTTAKGSTAYDFFSGAMGKMFDAAPSILQRDKVTVGWDESGAAIRNIENVAKSVANAARIMIDGGADIKKATGTISEAIIPLESADLISAADSVSAYNSISASIKAMKQQRDAASANEAAFRRLDLIMRGIPASMVDLRSEFSALIGNMKSGAFSLDDLDNKLYLLGLRMSRADFGEGGFSARIDGQAVELNQAIEMVAKDIPTTLRDSLKKAFTDKPLDGSEIFGKRFKENAIGTLYHTLLEVYKSAENKLIANIDQDISTKAAAEAAEAAPEVTAGLTGAFDEVPWDEKGAQAAQEYIDGMKAAAGIHSPSEVARKQIGIPLGEGMAIGVAQGFVGEGLKDIIRDAFAILGRQVNVELENLTYAGAKKMASDAIRDIADLGAAGDADMLASASRLSKRRSALSSTDPAKLGAAAGRSMADTLVAIRDNTKATVNAILALATRPVGAGPTVAGAVSGAAAGAGSVSGAAAAAGATAGAAAAAGAAAGAAAAGAAAGATAGATAARGKGAYPISDPFDRLPHPAPLTVDDTEVSANDLYRNFMMRASKQATDAKEQINVAKNRDLSSLSQADSDRMTAQVDALLETAQDRINESFDQTGKNYHDIMVTFQGILRDYQEGIEKIDQELAETAAKTRDDRTVEREKRKVQAQLKRGLDVATAQHSLDTQIEKLQRGLLGAIQQRRVAAGDSSILAKQETEVRDYITDLKTRAAVEIGNWTAKGLAPEQLGKAIGTFIRDMNLAGSELRSNIREDAGAEVVSGGAQTEIARINAQIKRRNRALEGLVSAYGAGNQEVIAIQKDIATQNAKDEDRIKDALGWAKVSGAAGPAAQRKELSVVSASVIKQTDEYIGKIESLDARYGNMAATSAAAAKSISAINRSLGMAGPVFVGFGKSLSNAMKQHEDQIKFMSGTGASRAEIEKERSDFSIRIANAKSNAAKLREAYASIQKARAQVDAKSVGMDPKAASDLRSRFDSDIAPLIQKLDSIRFDSLPQTVDGMVADVTNGLLGMKAEFVSTANVAKGTIGDLNDVIEKLEKWQGETNRRISSSSASATLKSNAAKMVHDQELELRKLVNEGLAEAEAGRLDSASYIRNQVDLGMRNVSDAVRKTISDVSGDLKKLETLEDRLTTWRDTMLRKNSLSDASDDVKVNVESLIEDTIAAARTSIGNAVASVKAGDIVDIFDLSAEIKRGQKSTEDAIEATVGGMASSIAKLQTQADNLVKWREKMIRELSMSDASDEVKKRVEVLINETVSSARLLIEGASTKIRSGDAVNVFDLSTEIKRGQSSTEDAIEATVGGMASSISKLQTQANSLGKWRDTMVRAIETSDLTQKGKSSALDALNAEHTRIFISIQDASKRALDAQGESIDLFLLDTKDQIARANAQIDKMLTDPKGMNFRRQFSAVNAAYADASSKFVDISKITYEEFKKFRDAQKALESGMFSPDRLLNFSEKFRLFVYGFRYGHPLLIKFGQALLYIGKSAAIAVGAGFGKLWGLTVRLSEAFVRLSFEVLKASATFGTLQLTRLTATISEVLQLVPRIGKYLAKPFDFLFDKVGDLHNRLRGLVGIEKTADATTDGLGDSALEASRDMGALANNAATAHSKIVGLSKTSSSLNKLSSVAGGNIVTGMGQGFVQAINSGGLNVFEGGLNKKTILTGVGLAMGSSLVRGVINSIQNAGYQVRNAFRSIFTRGVNEFMTREAVQGSLAFGVLDDQLRNAYKDKGGITNATKGTEEYATALKEAKIQGEELYKWLSELAVLSPFGKEEIQPLLKMALGSFDKENAKSIVATGIDVASVSQNAQDAEAYVRALSQIGAAGFLKKEDLNQINNMMAGNQILLDNLIDKDTKLPRFTTTGEMLDAITEKSITATEAIEAFQKGASLIFGGAAADMGGSLKGLLSSISDAINERLADAITPAIEQVGKPLIAFFFTLLRSDKVVGFFNRIGESIAVFAQNALTAFSGIYAFVSAIINMIPGSVRKGVGAFLAFGAAAGALGVALQIAALAVPILSAAMLALFNPISLIIGGIASLYVWLQKTPAVLSGNATGLSLLGGQAKRVAGEILGARAGLWSGASAFTKFGSSALDAFGDVQRGTVGAETRWQGFVKKFKGGIDTYIKKPLAKFRQDMGAWLIGWAQWWQAMAKTAWENIKKIPQMLIDVGAKMYSYGKNIVTWLAQGILDGAGAVLDAIFYIGGIIKQWIMPGSPPKFLPDIDKWGRETADVYLQGWTKADFGLVKDIASTIAGYLASDDGTLTNKESDAIYEAAAQAVSRFKETGVFDASGIQALSGDLSIEMGRLANAYALAAKSAAEMAAAQADLDAKTKEYDDLLKGLNKRLDILKGEETAADIEGQVKELQRVLNNAYATTQQRQLATNKIAQLRLEQEIAATEKRRDAELATIQERIDLSTKENKTATEALELMKERLDLSYSVGKKDAPGGGGGDTADTGVDKPDKGKEGAPEETELDLPKVPKMDLGTDELTKRIEAMKEKVTTALDGAKTAISEKVKSIKTTLGELRSAFTDGWNGGEGLGTLGPSGQGWPTSFEGFTGENFPTTWEGFTAPEESSGLSSGVIGMIADVGAAASQYKPKVDDLTKSVNAAKLEFIAAYNETPGSFIDKVFAGFNTQTIQEKITTAKTEIKGLSDYVKSEEFKANVELQIGKINLDTASKSLTGFRDKVIAEINSYTVEDKSLDGFRDEMVKELGETDLSPTAMTEFATNIVKHAGLAFGLVSMAGLAGSIASALTPALGKVGWLGVAGSLASAIAGGIGALGPVGWVVVGGAVAAAIGAAVSGIFGEDILAGLGEDPAGTIQETISEWGKSLSTMTSNLVNTVLTWLSKIDWIAVGTAVGFSIGTLFTTFVVAILQTIQKIDWKLAIEVIGSIFLGLTAAIVASIGSAVNAAAKEVEASVNAPGGAWERLSKAYAEATLVVLSYLDKMVTDIKNYVRGLAGLGPTEGMYASTSDPQTRELAAGVAVDIQRVKFPELNALDFDGMNMEEAMREYMEGEMGAAAQTADLPAVASNLAGKFAAEFPLLKTDNEAFIAWMVKEFDPTGGNVQATMTRLGGEFVLAYDRLLINEARNRATGAKANDQIAVNLLASKKPVVDAMLLIGEEASTAFQQALAGSGPKEVQDAAREAQGRLQSIKPVDVLLAPGGGMEEKYDAVVAGIIDPFVDSVGTYMQSTEFKDKLATKTAYFGDTVLAGSSPTPAQEAEYSKRYADAYARAVSSGATDPLLAVAVTGAGKSLADGLTSGTAIRLGEPASGFDKIKDAFVDGINYWFGIESPSKVTRDEVGKPLGEGILVGASEAMKETSILLADVNTVFTDITTEAATVLDAFFLTSAQSWVTYVGDTELQWISLKDRILLVAEQLKLAVTSKVQELADASRAIVDGIIAYFSSEDYIARWYGTGQNLGTAIGTGIADGMNGETVRGAIEDAAGSLIDLVRRELRDAAGVQSPSKVMAADVGRPLGLGVIQGMAQTGTEAQTAAGNFVAMMLAASMQAISRNGTISAPRASAYSAETELHVPDRTINQYNLYMSVTPSQAERINDNFRIMEIMS